MSNPTRSDEAIFAAALLHESPSARAAYLAVACAGDTALQARVEGLLRASASAAAFLERPIAVPRPSSPPTASPGSRPLDLDALALVSALALALEVPRLLEIRRSTPNQAVLTFAATGADPARFAVERASSPGSGADWKVEDTSAPIALRADGLFEATVTPPEAGAGTSLRGDAKFYRVRASP